MPRGLIRNYVHHQNPNLENYRDQIDFYEDGYDVVPMLPPQADPYLQLLLPSGVADKTVDVLVELSPEGILLPKHFKLAAPIAKEDFSARLAQHPKYYALRELAKLQDFSPLLRLLCIPPFAPTHIKSKHPDGLQPIDLAQEIRKQLNIAVIAANGLLAIDPPYDELNPLSLTTQGKDIDWIAFPHHKRKLP